ncbi:MAG: glycosyltransferase family A protein [Lachnospiraceae bacterium]|nr:glycosyltransferase family A protein [Lachnospiraceae bacterium]
MIISVILPVYNKAQYVSNMLSDIQQQSFRDFECLVIDDGSTDGSEDICDEFAKNDSRFQVFHIANGGVSHARNVGLDHASAEYITFVDADDRLDINYLLYLYQDMIASHADMVIGNYIRVWRNEQKQIQDLDLDGLYSIDDIFPEFVMRQEQTGIFGFCWAKLIPRKTIGNIRFNETISLAEDFEFFLHLYSNITTVFFTPEPLYFYSQFTFNSSQTVDDYAIDYFTQLKIQLYLRELLKGKKVYQNTNKILVDQKIEDYFYASIFYCRIIMLPEQIQNLKAIQEDKGIEIKNRKSRARLKNIILFLYGKNKTTLICLLLIGYRTLRLVTGRRGKHK